MSFSFDVKNELCKMSLENKCCNFAELYAFIRLSTKFNLNEPDKVYLEFRTENRAIAKRLFLALKSCLNLTPHAITRKSMRLKKKACFIVIFNEVLDQNTKNVFHKILEYNIYTQATCCKRAFLKGAFLACGSISDPQKAYHLEIISPRADLADEICEVMCEFDLNARVIERKHNYVIYLKEGENIVKFLNITGAHQALMALENIRILKEMRNNVNRIVNCETANVEKMVSASVRQIENINLINETMGLENLSDILRETAKIRLDNPEVSIEELGYLFNDPVGKSGAYHRLKKLDSIANEFKNKKR